VWDGNDNLTKVTDRNGTVTQYNYDALNRPTFAGFGYSGASYQSTIGLTWDGGNRLTQAADSVAGIVARAYDGLDNLVDEQTPQGEVTYGYDGAGRKTSMQVAGQSAVSYGWDNANRLTTINQGSTSVSLGYDTANRRMTLTLPNGVTVSYAYDSASRVNQLSYGTGGAGSTDVGTLTYSYDADGHVINKAGTLAARTLPAAVSGNTFYADNSMTAFNGNAISYDANGNMINDGTNIYTRDARNHLSTVSGGVSASFVYDPFGRRAEKAIGGTTTQFLYDDLNPVQELDGSTPANVSANLLTGLRIDEYFQRTDSNGAMAFLTDALGSTIGLTNSAGSLATNYTYQPFGATTMGGAANANSYQLTGRENDGTGLLYCRARYYNPTTGRFLSEDPIGFMAGLNFYAYVGGNPLRYRNPFGLSPFNFGSASTCFLKGAGNGALGALAVGGLAVSAAAFGAPVAAVTVGLGALAIGGGDLLGYNVYGDIVNSNWNGLAYNLGSLAGSSAVGGAGGRAIAEGINGVPSPLGVGPVMPLRVTIQL
jgi:RHS repeat-associated protein